MIVIVRVFCLVFLGLVVVAAATSSPRLWGVGAWGAVSPTAAAVGALLVLALLSGRLCLRLARAFAAPFAGRRWVLAAAAALVVLWRLRCAHYLWGGRYAEGLAAAAGAVPPAAPLSALAARGSFALFNRLFFWNAFEAAAAPALLAAVAFTAAAAAALRLVSDARTAPPGVSLALALAGGYAAVFFGCGTAIPLAVAAAGLFVLLSLHHLRGNIPLLPPALALLPALLLHTGTVFLAGGLLYLFAARLASPGHRREALGAAAVLILCWAAADLFLSSVTHGPGLASHLAAAAGSTFRAAAERGAPAGAAEAAGILLVLGPAATLGLVLAASGALSRGGRGNAEERFLLITALAAAAFIIVAAPKAQGGLRWDLFAPAGAVLALFAAARVAGAAPPRERLIPAAVLLAALGLYHLAPIVAANASLTAGRRRVAALPLAPGRAEHIIGAHAFHVERDYETAARRLAEAARDDPDNPALRFDLGLAEMRSGEPLSAAGNFYRALQLDPSNQRYRNELAEAYLELRWFNEAAAELEKLTAAYPDSVRLWTRLGYARNHGRDFVGAIAAYERALEMEPHNEQFSINLAAALLNRGAELQEAGEFSAARTLYLRARMTYPSGWVALNNLAALEMELENWAQAREIFSLALENHPAIPQLHFNMGLVMEQFGEYEAALRHLRRSAEIDAFAPPPLEHLERIENALEALGKAAPPDTVP